MKTTIGRVIFLAICSRLLCIFISFLTNDLFSTIRNTGILHLYLDNNQNSQNTVTWKLFKSFINWDGEYYLRISYYNDYEYEHQHAFLPLYPILVNQISKIVSGINKTSILVNMIVGTIISNLAFVLASVGLYLFQCELFYKMKIKNVVFPGISTLFFLFPSSNIFNSSMYTESLYSCFNFWGAFLILKAESNSHKFGFFSIKNFIYLILSVLCMSVTCGIRSNGILNSIPLFFYFVSTSPSIKNILKFILHWSIAFIMFISTIFPFLAYLIYSYFRYCVYISESRPWCKSLIPNIYSFVQDEYWSNGIFNYWRIEKFDKFILIIPFILVTIYSIKIFFIKRSKKDKNNVFSIIYQILDHFQHCYSVFGYFFQIYFLLISILLYGYVEVIIRLFNCIPLYFTLMGYFFQNQNPKLSNLLLIYQIFTFIFGSIWFPNFLPWT
ncbi:multi-pass transmembrane protein [Cryptosporidium parvum Iowa II]|uniref:GPI mannosyltransferase 2 n=2 Tax=Cryptosporidium parvum TaxID=5807 RepID=A3FPX8_CRYPI|nr:multi-pass transmembrane protein [Cryptosporidium parvum Iowa II]EAZ51551.1 multi-pass transmembrane protein, putative [Cryptosporidium parvum Iowa II]QOY41398.1 GPI mannosyltransferase 2 [Cryptosporidium parvum]WKS78627.1 putative multi-pass transmembrane protein [Cryptosporidium sp. 43IA8]|eukprot:QOY41398.1 hypothetical protein CPATCC_003101 [Cryptosporidium parvum]